MTIESNYWSWIADLTLIFHAFYVLFVVGGQVLILVGWGLGWAWTRHLVFRLLHLLAIAFVILEVWFGVTCPLTVLENVSRARAGEVSYEKSFIAHWLERMIYYSAPEWVFTVIYTVFGVIVVLTWMAYPPRRRFQ